MTMIKEFKYVISVLISVSFLLGIIMSDMLQIDSFNIFVVVYSTSITLYLSYVVNNIDSRMDKVLKEQREIHDKLSRFF